MVGGKNQFVTVTTAGMLPGVKEDVKKAAERQRHEKEVFEINDILKLKDPNWTRI
jgi:hypothetical protein